MLQYNFRLAFENFRRTPQLYALVAFTLALGIGLLSANLALVHTMTSDPIPHKSDKLFHVSMNTWPNEDPHEQPFYILSYRDADHILNADMVKNTAVIYASGGYIRDLQSTEASRINVQIRAASDGFFNLTDAPFAYGQAYQGNSGYEVVIGDSANKRVFGGGNSVGKTLELNGANYTVVGVLKPWYLRPLFYHATEQAAFNNTDDLFVPLETAIDENLPIYARSSSTDSWQQISDTRTKNVYYLQAWVEVENQQQKKEFQNYLDAYSQNLKDSGEHPNKIINQLDDVNTWLAHLNIVDSKVYAFALVSFLFLTVCVFNASSLLLSRQHSALFEHGLRRAIGASRMHLLQQGLVESCVLGVISAIIGLLLAWCFLQLSITFLPQLQNLAVLDYEILILSFILAIVVTNLSCLYSLIRTNKQSISAELK